MNKLPQVSLELIEYLERIYPDSSPTLGTPMDHVWFNSGKVAVVRHLRSVFDEQNETVLNGE